MVGSLMLVYVTSFYGRRNRREFYYEERASLDQASGSASRLVLLPCLVPRALPYREGSQQTIKLKCLPQAKVTRHKSKLAVIEPPTADDGRALKAGEGTRTSMEERM